MTETKLVMVGNYTYETDLDLKVGDKVVLPTPSWLLDVKPPTWTVEVTSLSSTFQGNCLSIISKGE